MDNFPSDSIRKCNYCGEDIKAGSRRCPYCGSTLDQNSDNNGLNNSNNQNTVNPGFGSANNQNTINPGFGNANNQNTINPGFGNANNQNTINPGFGNANNQNTINPGFGNANNQSTINPGFGNANNQNTINPGFGNANNQNTINPGFGNANNQNTTDSEFGSSNGQNPMNNGLNQSYSGNYNGSYNAIDAVNPQTDEKSDLNTAGNTMYQAPQESRKENFSNTQQSYYKPNQAYVKQPLGNGMKVFLTALSAVIPGIGQLIGIITAIVFMNSDDDADRKSFGLALLVASLVFFVISACVSCAFYMVAIGASGT